MLAQLQHNFNIIRLSEIKLSSSQTPLNNFTLPGYDFVYQPSLSSAGGVAIYVKIRPSSKKKILFAVLYRPPNSDFLYIKEFAKFLRLALKAKFDNIVITGDFNLPNIDWSTVTATTDNSVYSLFTKALKDYFLWQFIDFPTRQDSLLDLVLTTIPGKVSNIEGYEDILNTDHKLIKFCIDLRIASKPGTKRRVYNFKRADWEGLRQTLKCVPWDLCFVEDDINASLANWTDIFLTAVNQHIPTCKARNVNDHPWIDLELLNLLKRKDKIRLAANKSGSNADWNKFAQTRREVKAMIKHKKKLYTTKLKDSFHNNPKRFWSFIKTTTKQNRSPGFLRDGQCFVTDPEDKANLLNRFFQSVFTANDTTANSLPAQRIPNAIYLSKIQLTTAEMAKTLKSLDPKKAPGPDNIPGRLIKEVASEITTPLCRLFNLSLSLGIFPDRWKLANVSPVLKKDDPCSVNNYRPISLLCILSKTLERCVFNHCYSHISPQLYHLQHGFLQGRTTVTQLIESVGAHCT